MQYACAIKLSQLDFQWRKFQSWSTSPPDRGSLTPWSPENDTWRKCEWFIQLFIFDDESWLNSTKIGIPILFDSLYKRSEFHFYFLFPSSNGPEQILTWIMGGIARNVERLRRYLSDKVVSWPTCFFVTPDISKWFVFIVFGFHLISLL